METILFLHGWGGSAASFAPVASYFARDYQVLIPNLPCPPAVVYTLDDYVREVEAFLRAHQVTRCAVVAHSFGARLVALLAVRQPQLFSQIIISGGAGLKPRWSLRRWLKIRWYKWRKKLRGHPRGGSPDYRCLDANGKQTFQNIIRRDLAPEVQQIRVPTLLIYGNRDRDTPVYLGRRWQRLAPQARLKIYCGAGHFAYLEQSARFINDVQSFLTIESATIKSASGGGGHGA